MTSVRAIGADAEAFEGVANGHENVMAPPCRVTYKVEDHFSG